MMLCLQRVLLLCLLVFVNTLHEVSGSDSMFHTAAAAVAKAAEAKFQAGGGSNSTVRLSFFYKTACHNCLAFMQNALLPLLWANLPKDRVYLELLPWVPHEVKDQASCLGEVACAYAMDHLCALNHSLHSGPLSTNTSEMNQVAQFAYCDLYNAARGSTPEQVAAKLPDCAQTAGLAWSGPNGLQSCCSAENHGGFEVLKGSVYKTRIAEAKRQLKASPDQMAPFVFLDGKLLECPGPQWCSKLWTSEGSVDVEKPGTLLRVVCSRLYPVPQECTHVLLNDTQAVKPVAALKQGSTGACENCFDVGAFGDSPELVSDAVSGAERGDTVRAVSVMKAVAAVGVLGAAVAVVARGFPALRGDSATPAAALPMAVAE